MKNKRIIILTGNAGSGKTEFALQYALHLSKLNHRVNIVDLDVINIYFRSRENIKKLNDVNIKVWGSTNFEYNGSDLPALSYGFEHLLYQNEEYVIVDLAGTENGLKVLMALQNKDFEYEMLFVCNTYRPETDDSIKIVKLIQTYEKFSGIKITGIINNSNLLESTKIEDVLMGQKIVNDVAKVLNLPLTYTMISSNLDNKKEQIESNVLIMNNCINRPNWMEREHYE